MKKRFEIDDMIMLKAKIKRISKPYGNNYCYTVEIKGRAIHECQMYPRGVDIMEGGIKELSEQESVDLGNGLPDASDGILTNSTQQESEFCECHNRWVIYGGTLTPEEVNKLPCYHCHKPLKPKKKLEKLENKYEKPIEIELIYNRRKINEIIDRINERR